MRIYTGTLFTSLLLSFAFISTAAAQGVARGSIDVSGNGGITDLNVNEGKQGHASFGFSAGYNATRYVAVSADYNYIRLASYNDGGDTAAQHLQEYGASARFALINTRHVVPYALAGGGGVRDTASVSESGVGATASQSGGYFALGAGASFYLGHGFGVRPEFRFDRLQFASTTVGGVAISGGGQNALRATGAVFYQFGGVRK